MEKKVEFCFKENYFKHTYGVALKMRKLAELTGLEDPDKAYVIGYLHDIGKEFCGDRPMREHNAIGGKIMDKVGFNYSWAIAAHDNPNSAYINSSIVAMLNYCDLTIDNEGNEVSISKRLEEIKERYGADSIQTIDCEKLIKFMRHNTVRDWIAYFDGFVEN